MSGNQTSASQNMGLRYTLVALVLPALFIIEWINGGPNAALGILNMGLISAILALGVNLQWGYAGLFNVGIVGFVALGGLAPVLVSMPSTEGAFGAEGSDGPPKSSSIGFPFNRDRERGLQGP